MVSRLLAEGCFLAIPHIYLRIYIKPLLRISPLSCLADKQSTDLIRKLPESLLARESSWSSHASFGPSGSASSNRTSLAEVWVPPKPNTAKVTFNKCKEEKQAKLMEHPHAPAIRINGFSVSMPLCANSNLPKFTWFPGVFLSSSKALYSSWNLSGIFLVALTIDEPERVEAERLIVDLAVGAGPLLKERWRICEHDGQKNSRLARSGVLWMRET